MKNPLVGIVMGSSSDLSVMEEATGILRRFDIPYEMTVASAHRSPEKTREYARSAQRRGLNIIIAAAGGAAHLAGFIAAQTVIPVIGVPIASTPLRGIDALLATVQMPSGVPVATMALGRPGAKNAGILAAQILSLHRPDLTEKLLEYKEQMVHQVEEMGREAAKHGESSDSDKV